MKTDYESINDETLVPTANSTTYKGIAVLLFGAVTILLATVTVNTFNFNSSSDKFKDSSNSKSQLIVDLPAKLDSPTYQSPPAVVEKTTTTINKKPNFVFILADDLGANSVGYETYDLESVSPYLTSLAKDGIVMSNYYAQEICTPSRASLLTGRYPITIGMQYEELQPNEVWGLNLTEIIIPQVLKESGGYKSYAIGKWNLGHYTPEMLPTARGFDDYIGYLNGQNYYWSKKYPLESAYTDFIYADESCYSCYNESDTQTYSTFLYRDKAIQAIHAHDFNAEPMFMYLSVQAVHDPFDDTSEEFKDGIPKSYLELDMYNFITTTIPGKNRQQYAMALNLLDSSVKAVMKALAAKEQMDNTYIIFASDNGGCYQAGGRNGDLRGSKGSLFEGGVKVDSFIYSSLLPSSSRGTVYPGIMHVSDWFPTILELGGVSYQPSSGNALDGVSQVSAMLAADASNNEREYLLYNMYYKVNDQSFDTNSNAPVAIRDKQYKLAHVYTDNPQAVWYNFDTPLNDDDNMGSYSCPQFMALMGKYTKFLFDLSADPNERNNLYFNDKYSDVKSRLYKQMEVFKSRVNFDSAPSDTSAVAEQVWSAMGNVIVPWVNPTTTTLSQCTPKSSVFGWEKKY